MNYDKIPAHMRAAVKLYLERGIPPGDFLIAVLFNDLVGAYMRADSVNTAAMRDWADFMYNEMPGGSWGSKKAVAAWCKSRQEEQITHETEHPQ